MIIKANIYYFISKGKGIFESRHGGKYELVPGSLYLLYPHEWHRYRPLTSTGWEEFWGKYSSISEAETFWVNPLRKR